MIYASPRATRRGRALMSWVAALGLALGACSEASSARRDAGVARLGATPDLTLGAGPDADGRRGGAVRALQLLDTHETGRYNLGAAEIVDFHPATRRAFVVNSRAARVSVLELGARGFEREERALEPGRDLEDFAVGQVTSLAVSGDLVALAACATDGDRRGRVVFYSARELRYLGDVAVGYGPDMLTFTADGRRLLVANEGEQVRNSAQRILTDPEGSVSVIDVSRGPERASVAHASFNGFDGRIEEFRNAGVRIPRLGDSLFEAGEGAVRLSTDLEPEYIAVAADGKTAWVSLQENDAVAVLDVDSATFTDILPLGVKDFSRGQASFEDVALPVRSALAIHDPGEPLGLCVDAQASGGDHPAFYVLRDGVVEHLVLDRGRWLAGGAVRLAEPANGGRRAYRGLIQDPGDGTFWVGDARRSAAYHFTAEGRLLHELAPAAAPGGVVAVSLDPERHRLYLFLQGPSPDGTAGELARVVRILAIDDGRASPTFGEAIGEWLYVTNSGGPGGVAALVAGAAVEPSGRLLVLESGTDHQVATGTWSAPANVFRVDLGGASNVRGRAGALGPAFDGSSPDELVRSYGLALAHKQKVFALPSPGRARPLRAVHAQGLALLDDGRMAVGVGEPPRPQVALRDDPTDGAGGVGLTLVSFDEQNRFDASDRDGKVSLRHWPVLGGYMPDGIEALQVAGEDFFVTANEGDTRDYDAKRLADVELDPAHFPDAAALQSSASLGRLKISVVDGDLDADGDFDQIQAFGARSLSVWDRAGNLVFDTGSLFEEVTSRALASAFNSNNDDNGSFDSRSDDKGPEPEGLEIAEIDGRPYAFVGLERVGGVVVLDLADPRAPVFVEYVNPRDFSGSAQRGSARDLGPEGLKFVPADQSPTGRGLLFVANEVSGTTSAYDVNL
jgi:hypothetical protein